ncbi:MAG TPA: hypothetical protein VNE18_06440, partial [Rhodanobacter sp.]|nr:hypothetical protein [Rhodanobacter sp.]
NNDPTDQYAFDEETIGAYPFTGAAVAKHRLVVTGNLDGPWGFVFGGKLTLSTPVPDLNLACIGANTPSGCLPVSIAPPGNGRFLIGGKIFGYRDIDFQATKNFKVYGSGGLNAYVRIDLINAFNWNNSVGYLENWGSNGVLNKTPVTYNPTGDITGYPRTLRVSVGMNF